MILTYLKAKIHRATVTDANLEYEGSITIGRNLLDASGFQPFERVEIYNVTNGERFATYVMEGPVGTICINGAAAWKGRKGDIIIIAAYCQLDKEEALRFKPTLVYVDEKNEIKSISRKVT
jgi:aspartate 1-decarboxylase